MAYAAYFDGRLKDIEAPLLRAVEVGIQDNPIALFCAVRLFVVIDQKEEALKQFAVLEDKHPDANFTKASRWFVEALHGPLPAELFREEEAFLEWLSRDAEFAQFMLDVFALAGMEEEALLWLQKAVMAGFINYPFLAYHGPFLSRLRQREDFQQMLSTVKLEWEDFNTRIEEQGDF